MGDVNPDQSWEFTGADRIDSYFSKIRMSGLQRVSVDGQSTHAKGGILDAIIVPEHWCIAESGVVNPDRSSDQLRDHAVVHATVGFGCNAQLDRPHAMQDPLPVQTAMQRLRTTSRSVQDTIWARYSELVRMSSA